MREGEETTQKPSDSLWEKIRKPIKDSKTNGKPSDSYGERLEN